MSKARTMKEKTDILILTNTGGHLVAARALEAAFSALQPSLQITTIDFIEQMISPRFNGYSRWIYFATIKYVPSLYQWWYEIADKMLSFPQWKRRAASVGLASLEQHLDVDPPRLIVTAHPVPAGAVGEMKRRGLYSGAAITIITDHFVHSHWIHPSTDLYLAASERVQRGLIKIGIAAERIIITGIPIAPVFGVKRDHTQLRRQLDLAEDLPVVLVMGGAFGIWGGMEGVCSMLARFPMPLQAVISTGKNRKMRERLISIAKGSQHPIYVQGFIDDLPQWMGTADILISKAGGLTVSEAMASGLPMLIYRPIPCQEEANTRYLLDNGAAMRATDRVQLGIQLQRILSQPQLLEQMKGAASKIGRPDAAHTAARLLYKRYLK